MCGLPVFWPSSGQYIDTVAQLETHGQDRGKIPSTQGEHARDDARVGVMLESLVCTHELDRRPARVPECQTEAHVPALSRLPAASPGSIFQILPQTFRAAIQHCYVGLRRLV